MRKIMLCFVLLCLCQSRLNIAAYKIVLRDGRVIEAKSKPVSRKGSFVFTGLDNKTYGLPINQIDLDLTEASNHENTQTKLATATMQQGSEGLQKIPTTLDSISNKDVLDMHKSGLTQEIIVTKIKASPCKFDTSPSALQELKTSGIPDAVILAMVEAVPPSQTIQPSHSTPKLNPEDILRQGATLDQLRSQYLSLTKPQIEQLHPKNLAESHPTFSHNMQQRREAAQQVLSGLPGQAYKAAWAVSEVPFAAYRSAKRMATLQTGPIDELLSANKKAGEMIGGLIGEAAERAYNIPFGSPRESSTALTQTAFLLCVLVLGMGYLTSWPAVRKPQRKYVIVARLMKRYPLLECRKR